MPQQRVNHHVADQENLFLGYPFAAQVLDTALFRNEEQIGKNVGHLAVDLFRHAGVETAQSRFDVGQADAQLGCGDRCRERGIDVSHDQDHIRLRLDQHRLEPFHDLGRLPRVTSRADLKIDVGLGQTQVPEE